MKKLLLTRGLETLVNKEDYEWAKSMKWWASPKNGGVYANSSKGYLHRLILNPTNGYEVDHINGDPLDNRRKNLRLATRLQNSRNSKKRKDNTSGYKGVSWNKQKNKWVAKAWMKGKQIHLGYFENIGVASSAYNKGIKKLYGEFARPN